MTAAILNVRSAAAWSPVSLKSSRDFLRLAALDRRHVERPRLVCRWRRDPDGRLSCVWEQGVEASGSHKIATSDSEAGRSRDLARARRLGCGACPGVDAGRVLTLCTAAASISSVVPARDQKGMRCASFGSQRRSCPRNCERRACDQQSHWDLRVLGRWSRARTRKPGDLPRAAVTREYIGRGVLMEAGSCPSALATGGGLASVRGDDEVPRVVHVPSSVSARQRHRFHRKKPQ
jgi:hypothetical protein